MVKTKIIKELKCEFCGKGLRQEVNTWVVGGKEICIKRIPERCNCKQAKEYWKEQRELEHEKWLNTKIDKEKELSSYLCCNSNYDVKAAEKQLCYAKEDNDKERIDYWKNQVEIRLKKHNFIDSFINKFFDKVVTNKDFMEFKDRLKMELETI